MSFLKPIFLKNRVFNLLGLAIVLFALGFGWPYLVWCGFAVLMFIVSGIVVDLSSTNSINKALSAGRHVPLHFSLSDENEVILEFSNKGDKEIEIRVIDELPEQFQERNFNIRLKLEAQENKKYSYTLRPVKRGEYQFHNINLFFSGPLGFIEFRKELACPQMVKVYPSFMQMRKFELMVFNADHPHPGIRKIRRIGHGYEFSDIRQYVLGDDPRTVNWRASSRTGTLMVNNYQDEKSQQVYAIIDKSRVMRMPFNGLSLMDYAINSTLATLNIVLKNQDNAGLLSFSKNTESFIPASRKSNQMQLVLDALYNQKEQDFESNFTGLYQSIRQRIKNRSLLLLFTNFMSLNSLQRALPDLKRINRGHLLVVIFFENTELEALRQREVQTVRDIADKTLASKLSEELTQVIYELRLAGIQALKSKPEELTANTVNKYLELKSRGLV